MRKFFFGVFSFMLGLSCGFLIGNFIQDFLLDKGINYMLQGAIIIIFLAISFFVWRWMEAKGSKPKEVQKTSTF